MAEGSNKFVLRYPGQAMMFNMVRAGRLKKNGGANEMSETWANEDHDNYLIVRLIKSNGLPWMVAHHGIHEVFKGMLLLNANGDADTLTVGLRDHANRGASCIRRKFVLVFASVVEAQTFKFGHNEMIKEYLSSTKINASRRRRGGKRYASSSSSEDEAEEPSSPPKVLRKRRNGGDDDDDAKVGKEPERKKAKANENSNSITTRMYYQKDSTTMIDDCFENTPNPFGNDNDS